MGEQKLISCSDVVIYLAICLLFQGRRERLEEKSPKMYIRFSRYFLSLYLSFILGF